MATAPPAVHAPAAAAGSWDLQLQRLETALAAVDAEAAAQAVSRLLQHLADAPPPDHALQARVRAALELATTQRERLQLALAQLQQKHRALHAYEPASLPP